MHMYMYMPMYMQLYVYIIYIYVYAYASMYIHIGSPAFRGLQDAPPPPVRPIPRQFQDTSAPIPRQIQDSLGAFLEGPLKDIAYDDKAGENARANAP